MFLRLTFLLFLLCLTRVHADGGFKFQVAKPVEIPRQVAVVSHAEGMETLTIWNTLDAPSQSLAWILPLPAAPEKIEQMHPAALRLIEMACAPYVRTGDSDEMRSMFKTVPFLLTLLLSMGILLSKRSQSGIRWRLGCLPLLALTLLGLGEAFSGKLMSGMRGVSAVAGVRILQVQTAGNYETTVLRGDSPAAVNSWLSANGFSTMEGTSLVVHSCVDDG